MSIANYSSALIFLYILLLYCIAHWIYDAGLSGGLKIGGGACINMMGMIYNSLVEIGLNDVPKLERGAVLPFPPPLPQNWKVGGSPSPLSPLPSRFLRPFGCGSSISRLKGKPYLNADRQDLIWKLFQFKAFVGERNRRRSLKYFTVKCSVSFWEYVWSKALVWSINDSLLPLLYTYRELQPLKDRFCK